MPRVDQSTGTTHAKRETSRTIIRERDGVQLGFVDGKTVEGYFGSNRVVDLESSDSTPPQLAVGASVKVLTLKSEVVAWAICFKRQVLQVKELKRAEGNAAAAAFDHGVDDDLEMAFQQLGKRGGIHADNEARRKPLRSGGSPFQNSNLTSKWRRVCENQYILDEVAERVVTLQQVKMEATHVANLHCLRHFEHKYRPRSRHDHEATLVLNNTFFLSCCTLAEYRAERETVSGYKPPRLSYAGASLVELANAMVVNAANHITIHFNRRLSRCLELSFQLSRREMRVMMARLQREECEFTVAENEGLDWLQEHPQRGATALSIDEFRTSKLCSECYGTLQKVKFKVENDSSVIEPRDCRHVLRCSDRAYNLVWERDVNAAKNMLQLGLLRIHGELCPQALTRGHNIG
ncbi:hypothetical protein BBJ28_00011724 [Nothophytophthora sp. Chile5]|nr:hypothetical protein BBJ28_00011724 [Nothophytophthora sp. Chile5]